MGLYRTLREVVRIRKFIPVKKSSHIETMKNVKPNSQISKADSIQANFATNRNSERTNARTIEMKSYVNKLKSVLHVFTLGFLNRLRKLASFNTKKIPLFPRPITESTKDVPIKLNKDVTKRRISDKVTGFRSSLKTLFKLISVGAIGWFAGRFKWTFRALVVMFGGSIIKKQWNSFLTKMKIRNIPSVNSASQATKTVFHLKDRLKMFSMGLGNRLRQQSLPMVEKSINVKSKFPTFLIGVGVATAIIGIASLMTEN